MKILFVDSCIKPGEASRTKILCNEFINALKNEHPDYDVESIALTEINLKPFDWEMVTQRNRIIEAQDWTNPMLKYAAQFAAADRIIIGAPYWEMGFPSILKIYIENISVEGLTFKATDKGLQGICRSEKVMYIQTAGGFVAENDPGTEYMRTVMNMMGIYEFERISADGIDILGINVEEKLNEAKTKLKKAACGW